MAEIITEDWIVKLRSKSRPREVAIEVSTVCDLECIHCFRRAISGFKEEYMSMKIFSKVLENAVSSGVEKVALTGWGEPTAHPEFGEIVRLCKEYGLYVVLNTNGSRLHELSKLVAEGVDELAVSIDAPTEELYGVVRVGGRLSRVVEGIRELLEHKRTVGRLRPYVKLIYTVNRLNVHEAGALLDFSRKLGVNEVVYSYYIPPAGGEEIDCIGEPECTSAFEKRLSEAKSMIPELGIRIFIPTFPIGVQRACPFAQNRALFIRHDGVITPCVYYSRTWRTKILGVIRELREVALGDATKESLMSIWRERYVRMFYRLSFTRLPSCLTCKLVKFCEKTRSNENDCLGNAPTCAHCPFYYGLTYCPL